MSRTAIWRSIADTLSTEIASGHYGPGDKLPTEAQLSARFGVNRHTVRHALAGLSEVGTVHARRGAGVFVAAPPTDYPLGRRVRFHENVLAAGRIPSREFLRLETRVAGQREAEALCLSAGSKVHVVEGLSFVDAEPIALSRWVFPADRLPDLLPAMERLQSVTAALAEAGVADYTRASTRLTAKHATALISLHLRIPEGAPVLRTVAVNIDAEGVPLEYSTTWFAGDRVTLTVFPD